MPATTPRAYQIGDLDWKQAVKAVAVTFQNGNVNVVDGITFVDGDRALFAGQSGNVTVGSQLNGLYQWSQLNGGFIRSADASVQGSMSFGLTVQVTEGLTYADTTWVLSGPGDQYGPIDIGNTAIVFSQTGSTASGANGAVQFASGSGNRLASDPNFIYSTANTTLTVPTLNIANVVATGNISANYFIGNGAFLTGVNASSISGTFRGDVIAANLIPQQYANGAFPTLGSPGNPWGGIYSEQGVTVGNPVSGATVSSLNPGTASFINTQTGGAATIIAGDIESGNVIASSVTSVGAISAPSGTINELVTSNVTNSETITTANLIVAQANIGQLNYANGTPVTYVTEVLAGTGLQTADGNPISSVGTLSLAPSGVTARSYGSATQSLQVTFDQYGRATVAGNVTITPSFTNVTNKPTTLAGYGITDAVNESQLGIPSAGYTVGVATLDTTGKIPASQLPPIAITQTYVINTYSELTTLVNANVGDIAIVTANSSTYVLAYTPPTVITNWDQLLFPAAVVSVNSKTGAVVLNYQDVGAVSNVTTVTATNGLTGGGTLTSNITIAMANTAVTPGVYGDQSNVPVIAIDSTGRITSATSVPVNSTDSLIYSIALG